MFIPAVFIQLQVVNRTADFTMLPLNLILRLAGGSFDCITRFSEKDIHLISFDNTLDSIL